MTDTEIKEYTRRISQSNPTEIVVITYEIIINYIESAVKSDREGDMENMVNNLKKAKQFVNDLSSNLNFQYALSMDLMKLYRFSNTSLMNAIIKKNTDGLDIVVNIMRSLCESFTEVAKSDNRGPVINSSNQVFAGLTYGNNSQLTEYCYSFDKNGYLM